MESPEVVGALVGAAVAGVISVAVFVVGLIANAVSASRTRRGVAFQEVIEAFSEFAQQAIRSGTPPIGPAESRIIAASSTLQLTLGPKWKILGFWITGLQARLFEAVLPANATASAAVARQARIQTLLANLSNVLIDLHHGKLFRTDLLVPGGLFWAEVQGVDIHAEFPDRIEPALRPVSAGRLNAIRAGVISDGLLRPFLRLKVWLGFDAPPLWVPEEYVEAPKTP